VPTRSVALPVLCCVCVLLAGCSALGPAPVAAPSADSPTDTVTPAPIPGERVPHVLPGIGEDGSNETRRFRTVNAEVLGEGSHRARTVYQLETVEGGRVLARTVEQVRVENDTTMRLDYDGYGPDVAAYAVREASVWAGPNGAYRQIRYADRGEETERWNETGDARRVVRTDPEPLVETALDADLQPTDRYEVDDGTRFVLAGPLDRPPRTFAYVELADPRDADLTVRFDERGVVRAYVLEWRGTYEGREVVATYAVRVGQLGDAEAPRPAWVERFQTRTANATTPTPN
jgi:hypothetical protein